MSNWYRNSLVVHQRAVEAGFAVEAGRARDFAKGVGMSMLPVIPAVWMAGGASHVAPTAAANVQPAVQPVAQPSLKFPVATPPSAPAAPTPNAPVQAEPQAVAEPQPRQKAVKDSMDMDMRTLSSELKTDEGNRSVWYNDHLGKPTIGVGHLIIKNDPILERVVGRDWKNNVWGRVPLTQQQIDSIFLIDIQKSIAEAKRASAKFGIDFTAQPPVVQRTLVKMCFQMGSVNEFQQMMKAIKRGDYQGMVREMMDSKWAKEDTPDRAARTAKQIADHYSVPFDVPQSRKRR